MLLWRIYKIWLVCRKQWTCRSRLWISHPVRWMLFPADLTAKEKEKGQCRVKTEEIILVNRLVVLRRQKWEAVFAVITLTIRHVTRIVLPVARNVMHAARLDILQSVAKQRNANLLQEMTREGIIHGVEPINYQRIQPLANKIIMHLQSRMPAETSLKWSGDTASSDGNRLRFHNRPSEIIGLPQPIDHRL